MSQMEPMPMPDSEEPEPEPQREGSGDGESAPQPEPEVEFRLKFEGELNQVDASTLGYSLINVTTIIREISQDLAARIEIKVKSTEPGSFVVRFALEALNDPLFQAQLAGAGTLGLSVLKTFTELFKLRKLLQGEPPKSIHVEGDYYEIRTGDNATIKIEKPTYRAYFTNPRVNEALAKTFEALESDRSIKGLEITDAEEHPLFEASRGDFAPMALTTSVPQVEERDEAEDTQVHIVKPSFDPKLKWDVLYKGNRISAWMRDNEFQARIERGERFAKGDILAIDLKVHQKLDPSLGTYVNKSYEIVRVKEHIPRAEQSSLFFIDLPPLPEYRALHPGRAGLLREEKSLPEADEPDEPEPDSK